MYKYVLKRQSERVAKLGLDWDSIDKSGFGLFEFYVNESELTKKTADLRRRNLNVFKDWLIGRGVLNISDISESDVIDYKEWLLDDSKHKVILSTRRTLLLSVKSFFSWVHLFGAKNLGFGVTLFNGHRDGDTQKTIKPKHVVMLERLLVKMEKRVNKSTNHIHRFEYSRDYAIMLFQFETACHVFSLNTLRWSDLFFKRIDGRYFPYVRLNTKKKNPDGTPVMTDNVISDRLYDALYYLRKYGQDLGFEITDNKLVFSKGKDIIKNERMSHNLIRAILNEYDMIKKGINVAMVRDCGIYNMMQKSDEDIAFMMKYLGLSNRDRLNRYKKSYQTNKERQGAKRKKEDFLNII